VEVEDEIELRVGSRCMILKRAVDEEGEWNLKRLRRFKVGIDSLGKLDYYGILKIYVQASLVSNTYIYQFFKLLLKWP
jgi:hypothetical protein